jgi:23S rRNA pseudouridine955/2504/2580 synthase
MSGVRIVIVAREDDGQRLDRWLKKYVPDLPYALVQKLIRKGQIRIDGGRAKTDTRLSEGQEIRLPPSAYGEKQDEYFKPKKGDADFVRSLILYDDGDLMAINKPAGYAAQGGLRIERHIDGLMDNMAEPDGTRPKLCHRLDRDTSGVLLLARNRETVMKMGRIFEQKNIRKYYLALVAPAPEMNGGTIDAPLRKGDGDDRDMMIVDRVDGKFARSEFRVLERAAKKAAVVALWPRTGRTHQLRVHALTAGFPIVGDPKYGNLERDCDMIDALGLSNRMHLHAYRVIFPHPNTRQMMDISAPLPADLKKSWEAMGFDPHYNDDPFGDVRI